MNRQIAYPGQLLPETLLLGMAKDSMVGMGWLAQSLLGITTQVSGLDCAPTATPSMAVTVGPGAIYKQAATDASAYSTSGTDAKLLLKQGLFLTAANFSCPAPGTAGQSINYLIQATYQDADSGAVVLPYYNSTPPHTPFSGVGGDGLSQPTVRSSNCVVSVKAGTAATTGSQTTPAADSGYVGLWVVTVANGATTITSGNIAKLVGAPFISMIDYGIWLNTVVSAAGFTPDQTNAAQFKAALDALYVPQGDWSYCNAAALGSSGVVNYQTATITAIGVSSYSSGTVTVSNAGRYRIAGSFSAGYAGGAASASEDIEIYKNGAPLTQPVINHWHESNNTAEYATLSVETHIALSAGDTVAIHYGNGGGQVLASYGSFTGHRLG